MPKLREPRANLTLRVTVRTEDEGVLYLGGDGTWFGDPGALLENAGPDTWQFDIQYSSDLDGFTCHNCPEYTDHVLMEDQLYIQIYNSKGLLKELTPMLGPRTKIKFPISATSSFLPCLQK